VIVRRCIFFLLFLLHSFLSLLSHVVLLESLCSVVFPDGLARALPSMHMCCFSILLQHLRAATLTLRVCIRQLSGVRDGELVK
jgi:hypothetical protein